MDIILKHLNVLLSTVSNGSILFISYITNINTITANQTDVLHETIESKKVPNNSFPIAIVSQAAAIDAINLG